MNAPEAMDAQRDDDECAGPTPGSLKAKALMLFQALLLMILLVGGMPTIHPAQRALRRGLDGLIDGVGLWQGQWELFAPNPDRSNARVVAIVEFEDGATAEWRSPEWQELSALARFRHFRMAEFVDGIRQDNNKGAWPAFARWAARQVAHPQGIDSRPVRVELWRHWVVIPPPTSPLPPLSSHLPMDQRAKFYERRLVP